MIARASLLSNIEVSTHPGYHPPVSQRIGLLVMSLAMLRGLLLQAQPAIQITPLTSPQLWKRLPIRISNVPATSNPFDPDIIRVDAEFRLPSGRIQSVPAFWYQAYERSLSNGYEVLTKSGTAEWRVRFVPPEPGNHSLTVSIRTNGQVYGLPTSTNFDVASSTVLPGTGYVRLAPGKQYFETGDGQALRLIGHNVCWYSGRGTYDYDDWFSAMQASGENYARLWMWPYAFNLETEPNSLTRYRLDRAWQL